MCSQKFLAGDNFIAFTEKCLSFMVADGHIELCTETGGKKEKENVMHKPERLMTAMAMRFEISEMGFPFKPSNWHAFRNSSWANSTGVRNLNV